MNAGAIVAERYRLERKLGEGGMGAVWEATHMVTRKRVAIKTLRPELAMNASLVERFLREARAACAVQHPNVVQIHDVLQTAQGTPLMVMDLLDGQSLAERLIEQVRLQVPELARIMVKVLPAVAAAHAARVVHRDLKPDNLFLCRTDDGSVHPKVLDFGIAKVSSTDAESGVLTKTGSMLGTPFYMAPEQLFGEKDVDFRADIWSLGIIVYECLSGARPTEADNLGQIIKLVTAIGILPLESVAPHVPPDICLIVNRMLTSDRHARLSDLGEARAIFERYVGASGSVPPAGWQSGHAAMHGKSDTPAARTGLTHRATTQSDLAAPPTPKRPWWPFVAIAAGVSVVGSLAVAVPRLRSAPPKASAGSAEAAPREHAPSPPPVASPGLPVATTPSTAEAVDAAVAAPPAASAASLVSRRAGDTRPIRHAPHVGPWASPPVSPASSSSKPGVLVEKPPF